ncbi:DUF6350 family protein [Isoptericola sp. b490]|uniref:cell division protein PerM n=1 Tax=Actinotalea lenta TaxID=3064654 RepID=UPI002712440C|nr:DUF6350 family protein [Isoptericola sp. b490]MDO8122328.1 DUF6350 family protein [Isoptericola sp. b490]
MSRPALPPSFPATRPVAEEPAAPRGRRRWPEAVDALRQRVGQVRLRRPAARIGPSGLAAGLFAGVQGALLSLLVVVVPAIAAYVATSADPANDRIGWSNAVAVGSALWLLAQGGALEAGGASVTLVPLGLTALVVFAGYASARRSSPPTPGAWLTAVAGHLALTVLVVLGAGGTGPAGAGGGAVARTLAGAAACGALGLGLGATRRGALGAWLAPRVAGVPTWLRAATRAGLMVPALLVLLASAVTATWAVAGRAATGDVIEALGADSFGGVTLAVAQLGLAPNLVLWAVSWLTGTGFAVGAGTRFAPDQVLGGPMPAIPLLGALPTQAGGLLSWAPAAVVVVTLPVAWWLRRRMHEEAAWQPLAAAALAASLAAVTTGALAAASGGPVGPGRLAVVGPAPGLVVLDTVALVLPALVLVVPGSALVREAVRGAVRRARHGD